MLHLFIPSPNTLPKNIDFIEKNIIESSLDDITEFKFCVKCTMALNNANVCTNQNCEKFNLIVKHYDSFHSVGITKQLNHIITKNYSSISKYLNDTERPLLDLIDGSQYKKKDATLNLLTYTDGIQIYKSSSKKSCVWPVLCNIIELPQKIRE